MQRLEDNHRRLFGSRTGLHVSPLGFGGAPIGYVAGGADRSEAVLHHLLDHGVNVIDTAACYFGSEELIGRSIGNRRDDFILISKCGHRVEEGDPPPGSDWDPKLITHSIDRSLQRLRTDRIDVMLLHSCDQAVLDKGEALDAVLRARDAGKVRFAGYSGDNAEAAWAAQHPEIAVIETSINIVDQANIDLVLPHCRANGIGVIVKRPIANAAWKTPDQQYSEYVKYYTPYHTRLTAVGLTIEAIAEAAGQPDLSWPEAALRFVLAFPEAHTLIVGTTRIDNVDANIAAVRNGPLPKAAVDLIRSAWRNAPESASWEGLT